MLTWDSWCHLSLSQLWGCCFHWTVLQIKLIILAKLRQFCIVILAAVRWKQELLFRCLCRKPLEVRPFVVYCTLLPHWHWSGECYLIVCEWVEGSYVEAWEGGMIHNAFASTCCSFVKLVLMLHLAFALCPSCCLAFCVNFSLHLLSYCMLCFNSTCVFLNFHHRMIFNQVFLTQQPLTTSFSPLQLMHIH